MKQKIKLKACLFSWLQILVEEYKGYGYELKEFRPAIWWKDGLIADYVAIMELPKEEKIQKLSQSRGVKLSSTVAGQRELLREYRNKLNEVIEHINK